MRFYEKAELDVAGGIEQEAPREVEGLLVADVVIASWYEYEGAGTNLCQLYPAYREGTKCFLLEKSWRPARGYSERLYGLSEEIVVELEEGIKLALEHGWCSFK